MRRLPFALQNPAAALDSERRERVRVSPAGRRAANDRRRRAARRRCYFESHPQHSQGLTGRASPGPGDAVERGLRLLADPRVVRVVALVEDLHHRIEADRLVVEAARHSVRSGSLAVASVVRRAVDGEVDQQLQIYALEELLLTHERNGAGDDVEADLRMNHNSGT